MQDLRFSQQQFSNMYALCKYIYLITKAQKIGFFSPHCQKQHITNLSYIISHIFKIYHVQHIILTEKYYEETSSFEYHELIESVIIMYKQFMVNIIQRLFLEHHSFSILVKKIISFTLFHVDIS